MQPVAATLAVHMRSHKRGVAVVRIYPYPALLSGIVSNDHLIFLENKNICLH